MRQIAGAFAATEKARSSNSQSMHRDRERKELGKCEARRSSCRASAVVELAKEALALAG